MKPNMRTVTALALSAFAASALAQSSPVQLVKNYCHENVFLTFANSSSTSAAFQLASGEAYTSTITGVGNSLGVTKTADYWNSSTAKLILGTSVSNTILYWTVSDVDGDPFAGEGFNVTSTNGVCGQATGYDGQVHACGASGVTLTLNLC